MRAWPVSLWSRDHDIFFSWGHSQKWLVGMLAGKFSLTRFKIMGSFIGVRRVWESKRRTFMWFWDKFTKVTVGNCLQISLFIAKNDFEFYNQSDDNKFLALRREDCVYDEILNSILLKIYRISIRKFERKWHQRNRTFNCYIEFTRVKYFKRHTSWQTIVLFSSKK